MEFGSLTPSRPSCTARSRPIRTIASNVCGSQIARSAITLLQTENSNQTTIETDKSVKYYRFRRMSLRTRDCCSVGCVMPNCSLPAAILRSHILKHTLLFPHRSSHLTGCSILTSCMSCFFNSRPLVAYARAR